MALKAATTTTTKSIKENNNNNKIKQKVLKITSTNSTTSNFNLSSYLPPYFTLPLHAWGIQYYDYIIIWGFNVYIIIDLVERRVLTLVGEIWRYRNDRYRYYY